MSDDCAIGAPNIPQPKPTVPQVLDRFVAYHAREPAWGSLHVALDDLNLRDDDVRFCITSATEKGDVEGAALGSILLAMSKTQRRKIAHLA